MDKVLEGLENQIKDWKVKYIRCGVGIWRDYEFYDFVIILEPIFGNKIAIKS